MIRYTKATSTGNDRRIRRLTDSSLGPVRIGDYGNWQKQWQILMHNLREISLTDIASKLPARIILR